MNIRNIEIREDNSGKDTSRAYREDFSHNDCDYEIVLTTNNRDNNIVESKNISREYLERSDIRASGVLDKGDYNFLFINETNINPNIKKFHGDKFVGGMVDFSKDSSPRRTVWRETDEELGKIVDIQGNIIKLGDIEKGDSMVPIGAKLAKNNNVIIGYYGKIKEGAAPDPRMRNQFKRRVDEDGDRIKKVRYVPLLSFENEYIRYAEETGEFMVYDETLALMDDFKQFSLLEKIEFDDDHLYQRSINPDKVTPELARRNGNLIIPEDMRLEMIYRMYPELNHVPKDSFDEERKKIFKPKLEDCKTYFGLNEDLSEAKIILEAGAYVYEDYLNVEITQFGGSLYKMSQKELVDVLKGNVCNFVKHHVVHNFENILLHDMPNLYLKPKSK